MTWEEKIARKAKNAYPQHEVSDAMGHLCVAIEIPSLPSSRVEEIRVILGMLLSLNRALNADQEAASLKRTKPTNRKLVAIA